MGAQPQHTWYVGDTPSDMRSGRAAGVHTAAALWGPGERSFLATAEPEHWLEQPADLVPLVAASTDGPPERAG